MAKVKKFNTKGKGMKPFQSIPGGKYLAKVLKTLEKATAKKTGHFVEITWEVLKGKQKGNKFWSRLNLDNPNEKAVEIAEDEYVTICEALGFKKTEWDTEKLHGKRCLVTVVEAPSDRGGTNNECKNYENPKSAKKDDSSEDGGGKPWDDEPEDSGKKKKKDKSSKKGKGKKKK